MTSRYQDNFRHKSFSSPPTSHNTFDESANSTSKEKKHKWYNPANLLKITPEPVNAWASDPFSSERAGKEENRRASVSPKLQDQHRGYAGGWKIVGYYKP